MMSSKYERGVRTLSKRRKASVYVRSGLLNDAACGLTATRCYYQSTFSYLMQKVKHRVQRFFDGRYGPKVTSFMLKDVSMESEVIIISDRFARELEQLNIPLLLCEGFIGQGRGKRRIYYTELQNEDYELRDDYLVVPNHDAYSAAAIAFIHSRLRSPAETKLTPAEYSMNLITLLERVNLNKISRYNYHAVSDAISWLCGMKGTTLPGIMNEIIDQNGWVKQF